MRVLKSLEVDITNKERTYTIKGYWLFLIQFFVIGLSYYIFLNPHFSVDSYSSYSDASINHYLSLGRVINYAIAHLLKWFNIDPVRHQAVFIGLLIFFMAVSAALLTKRYCTYLKTISLTRFLLINLCISISFVNVYILEWYLFPEVSFIYGLGFLFATIAVLSITTGFRIRNLLVCTFFLFLSETIYQTNVTVFIIFSLVFLLVKNLHSIKVKTLFQIILPVFLVSGLTMVANVVLMRLLPLFGFTDLNDRIMNITPTNLWDRFVSIFTEGQSSIWFHGSGFLGLGIMFAFLLVSIILLISVIFKYREQIRTIGIVSIFLILLLNYAVVLFPHLLTSVLWMAPRTIVGIFLFLTSIYLIVFTFPLNLKLKRISAVVLIVFLVINIIQISNIGINVFSTNKIDRELVHIITTRIEKYEEDSDVKITKIAVANDTEPQYGYYSNVDFIRFDTNVRAFVVDWAVVPIINYYNNREFVKVSMPDDVFNAYFKGKNWSAFDPEEQLVLIGDTLYMIAY